MPDEAIGEVVIRGITTLGRPFRPSDWADRLASIVSHVGRDNRLHYSPDVQPVTRAGVRCVVIDRGLAERDARIFKFLLDFARENDLEVVDGRKAQR
ncbi:MAG: DUF3579 domain-containing protein [Pseudomonadota bacterium]|nr:DUF3579 domain-containing protein [Pseudomonadota bacterium]